MTTLPATAAPTPDEVEIARVSSHKLAALVRQNNRSLQVRVDSSRKASQPVELPRAALRLLVEILSEMGKGNAVTLLPIHAQLTTQQAADLLGVSRPFLVKQLKAGELKYQKVGTHRRIRYRDLLAFRDRMRCEHDQAMDELVKQAQEDGMGY